LNQNEVTRDDYRFFIDGDGILTALNQAEWLVKTGSAMVDSELWGGVLLRPLLLELGDGLWEELQE
jgi:hypothetical protein